jgi:chemotaxis protein methyltransferase CheR
MTPNDYQYLCQFLLEKSGLSLGNEKEYLLEGRLEPLAQSLGHQNISELVTKLKSNTDRNLGTAVVEAMTTNETLFFRDRSPFDDLTKSIIPQLFESNQTTRRIRIWSAACSSGQEAYSILMTLMEAFPNEMKTWTFEIVGTDIDTKMVERARSGVYTQFEVQRGLSIKMLMNYFEQCPQGWKVKDSIRTKVSWKFWNLLDPFTPLGQFDIIFCRNVLIYFNPTKKAEILTKMSQQLAPKGSLVLGSAETILGNNVPLKKRATCTSSVFEVQVPAAISSGAPRPSYSK